MSPGHHTHEKHPAAGATGLASLLALEEGKLVEHAAVLVEKRWRARANGPPAACSCARGTASACCWASSRPDRAPPAKHRAEPATYEALRRVFNAMVLKGNVLTFAPSLTLSGHEPDPACTILVAATHTVTSTA